MLQLPAVSGVAPVNLRPTLSRTTHHFCSASNAQDAKAITEYTLLAYPISWL